MSVTLSRFLISFPPMMFMDFGPVQNAIGWLGDMYDIEGVTANVDDGMKVVGLRIDEDAPSEFVQHIYTIVKKTIDKVK